MEQFHPPRSPARPRGAPGYWVTAALEAGHEAESRAVAGTLLEAITTIQQPRSVTRWHSGASKAALLSRGSVSPQLPILVSAQSTVSRTSAVRDVLL